MGERIAQACADPTLAVSRERALRSAGYNVSTFRSASELVLSCMKLQFHLLIMEESLDEAARDQIRNAFRKQNPGTPILQLTAAEAACEADYAFKESEGDAALVSFISQILRD